MSNLRIPLLPYAGTSGWSGSDTSRARAVRADSDGTTSAHQRQAISSLSWRGSDGVTWRELADEYGWHHGTASGILSVLHKEGVIARLSTSRNRCTVSGFSSLMPTTTTPFSLRSSASLVRCGMLCRQGPHQVAQNSST